MLSPKNRRLLKKIGAHLIIWVLGSAIYLFIEKGILGDATAYPSTGNTYDFGTSILGVTGVAIVLGLILALLEENVFKDLLRKKPFSTKLVTKTFLYLAIILVTMTISTFVINSILMGKNITNPEVLGSVQNFMGDFVFLSILVYLGAIIGLSLFFSEMIDYIGINAIANFFTGNYASAKEEGRIFMFLDMKASTRIAEKLGHLNYYELLNHYYEDMTDSIINSGGEIYQYVGDEIIVSWKENRGLIHNNAINCFFQIKDRFQKQSDKYKTQFGTVPTFKAGFHCGKITYGEIGRIKKELLFTGDVLNTTARIQSLCNELQVDLLISNELKSRLPDDPTYEILPMGAFALRGRDQQAELFTVKLVDASE